MKMLIVEALQFFGGGGYPGFLSFSCHYKTLLFFFTVFAAIRIGDFLLMFPVLAVLKIIVNVSCCYCHNFCYTSKFRIHCYFSFVFLCIVLNVTFLYFYIAYNFLC